MVTKRAPFEPTQLDLGFSLSPRASEASTSIDARRVKRSPSTGWHGMLVAQLEVDWSLTYELAPDGQAVKVLIEPRSPAYKEGLRTGDYVLSASTSNDADMPLTGFDALGLPAGTAVYVRFCRPRLSRQVLRVLLVLKERPKAPKIPDWRRLPRTPLGPEVGPEDRKRFLAQISASPNVTAIGVRILTRLLHQHDGPRGIWPAVSTIAEAVGLQVRATQNQLRRLEWAGVLEIVSRGGTRTKMGWTNRYVVHWADTVVQLRPRK